VLTPDGDGQDDFTTINYQFANGGGVMSITIYDVQGREIRRLLENQTVSTAGFITWDGVNAEGKKTPIGYYVLWIEVFDLTGRKQTFKETLAVGMRF
jgi:flagellar hook assembly protein FlgD